MKKILFAITGLGGGGAERVVSVWSSQLAECGYDIAILTYVKGENEYKTSDKVQRITITESKNEYLSLSYIKRLQCIRKAIKSFNPDTVISFLPRMQIWMMMASVGMKFDMIQTVRISPWHNKTGKLESFLWKRCFRKADKVLLQSNDQKPFFSKKVQKKCYVVPNPLNKIYETNRKTSYPDTTTKFIANGRLSKQKNYFLMIDAFAKASRSNPNITLDIFGAENEISIETLRQYVENYNLSDKIKICGWTADVLTELLTHDAYIMSSNFEGMPNALAEAMAVGLPCISTDCRTGPRDLIDDGENGFLTEVGNIDALATAIEKVASLSSDEAKHLGQSARNKILSLCCEENSLKKLIEMIEK